MEARTRAISPPAARPMEVAAKSKLSQPTGNQPKSATHLPCDLCLAVFSLTIVTFAVVGLALNFQAMRTPAAPATIAVNSLVASRNVTLVGVSGAATVGLGFAIAAVVASIRDGARHAIAPNLALLAAVASFALLLWVMLAATWV